MPSAREVIRRISEEVLGQGRLDLVDELVHEDFVDHTAMEGVPGGREGLKAFARMVHSALSDASASVERTLIDGDQVAWRWSMWGKHTGEFMGIPATGSEVVVTANVLGVMRDGKLAELWSVVDMLSVMVQLGAIESPGA